MLDRWILAAARSLTAFVRQEMEGYRLYTVVPQLVTFIDQLTNIYVRYNRKRLKVWCVSGRCSKWGEGCQANLIMLMGHHEGPVCVVGYEGGLYGVTESEAFACMWFQTSS